MAKMTERELSALVAAEQSSALGYLSSQLTIDRERAMDYYLGEPLGNEQKDRSRVVMTEVADTIEWILPALLKIFTAGEETVRFEPQEPGDEEAAKQATEYVNFIFNRDNPGFIILHSMFKDALLQKNGIGKVWWDDAEKTETRRLPGLDANSYALAAAEAEADDWEADQEDGDDGDVTLVATRQVKRGRVKVEPVPPEEFLISRDAKTIADAAYVAHRTPRTRSSLVADGFRKSVVDGLAADDSLFDTGERRARLQGIEDVGLENIESESANKAMQTVMLTESYIQVDWDGDGIAEMRRVVHAGKGCTILENEAWQGPRPFVSLTPILMPHRFYGRSIADLVMDLQEIKSTVLRQILDNLYLSNNVRYAVSDAVNLDDMLVSRPGGLVRLKHGALPGTGHVMPLVTPAVVNQAFPMMEYLDTVRENRTGVTRYNQGIDANSLNKTASGISQIMSAAQQRIELIARVFAETGVKDLFALILYLVRTHQDEPRQIRLRNTFVAMEPATWPADFDLTVSVGLGTGNRDLMAAHLTQIGQLQLQAVQLQGGANGPLVTLDNLYNTGNAMAHALGFKEEGKFFTDPAQAQPQEPSPPDPAVVKAETDAKLKAAELQVQMKTDGERLQFDREKASAELALKQKELGLNAAMGIRKQQDDMSFAKQKHGEELGFKREALARDAATRELVATSKGPVMALDGKTGRLSDVSEYRDSIGQLVNVVDKLGTMMLQCTTQQAESNAALVAAVTKQKTATVTKRDAATGRVQEITLSTIGPTQGNA